MKQMGRSKCFDIFLGTLIGCVICLVLLVSLQSRTFLEYATRSKAVSWSHRETTGNHPFYSFNVERFLKVFLCDQETASDAETWAKHCDDYVFVTNRNEENGTPFWVFDFGDKTQRQRDNKRRLWDRIRAMFKRVEEEKLNDFDWFLKADDDSFVVIENLKEFLVDYDPNSPYLVGAIHSLGSKSPKSSDYMTGGAGYLLSREGVTRFISIMNNNTLCSNSSTVEDVELGKCMRNAGATFINPQDDRERGQMFQLNLVNMVDETLSRQKTERSWMVATSRLKARMGKDCCSDKLISTHHLDAMEMKLYYYLVYGVKVASPPNSSLLL